MTFKEHIFVYVVRYSAGVRWLITALSILMVVAVWWYGSYRALLHRYQHVRQEYVMFQHHDAQFPHVRQDKMSTKNNISITPHQVITLALDKGLVVESCSSEEHSNDHRRIELVLHGSFENMVAYLRDSSRFDTLCWESGEWSTISAEEIQGRLIGLLLA